MMKPPAASGCWGWWPRGRGSATSVKGQLSSPPLYTSPASVGGSRSRSGKNSALKGRPWSTSQW